MFGRYAKAIFGAIYAGLVAVEAALDDGGITAQEGVKAAIAVVVGLGIISQVPNTPIRTTAVVRKPGEPTTVVESTTE